jgi:predicted nucleotidyltransferase
VFIEIFYPQIFNEDVVMRPSQLLQKRRKEILQIMSRYPMLSNLRVAGSVARGEDSKSSDIDFLIDPSPGATLFDMGGLHEDLEELLGVPVDIISSRSNREEYMKTSMLKDAVHIRLRYPVTLLCIPASPAFSPPCRRLRFHSSRKGVARESNMR